MSSKPPFKRGAYVCKRAGSKWEGVVVACYQSWETESWHIVVEFLYGPARGAEHLYPANLFDEVGWPSLSEFDV